MKVEPGQPSKLLGLVARAILTTSRCVSAASGRIKGYANVGRFGGRGRNFVFDPQGTYTYGSIFVGDNVNLGVRPTIMATRAVVSIGSNVVFGPGVTIRGGNHRFDLVGRFIVDVDDSLKRKSDDRGVRIEDDVWIGGGATVLHGVTVGRGSVIGAGAVVTRTIPPYSVVAGNPGRVVRSRFSRVEVLAHEQILYPLESRLCMTDLEHLTA